MSQFRLHIDIPVGGNEADALVRAKQIIEMLSNKETMQGIGVEQMNYRVGHDEDRQKSNYLIKTESGHVNNKKSRIMFTEDLTGVE
jgi:hypothetical protein